LIQDTIDISNHLTRHHNPFFH